MKEGDRDGGGGGGIKQPLKLFKVALRLRKGALEPPDDQPTLKSPFKNPDFEMQKDGSLVRVDSGGQVTEGLYGSS